MGCGSSSPSAGQACEPTVTLNNSATNGGSTQASGESCDNDLDQKLKQLDQSIDPSSTGEHYPKINNSQQDVGELTKQLEGKCFVAFDVALDGDSPVTTALDSLISRTLPSRLRHLEPITDAPQLTSEMLMDKLGKAEEKRKKALAKRKGLYSRRQAGQRKKNATSDHLEKGFEQCISLSEAQSTKIETSCAVSPEEMSNHSPIDDCSLDLELSQCQSACADDSLLCNDDQDHHRRGEQTEQAAVSNENNNSLLNLVSNSSQFDSEMICLNLPTNDNNNEIGLISSLLPAPVNVRRPRRNRRKHNLQTVAEADNEKDYRDEDDDSELSLSDSDE